MASAIKEKLSTMQYSVSEIEKKTVKRSPYAPFTTSTLQQDSVRKLGFSAKKTMQLAQKLYEGISVDGAVHGLITYMRTDSVALSADAVAEARTLIKDTYGSKYLPNSPRVYKTKTKNAQEAHEAIRPTSFSRTPEGLRGILSVDEAALYELIWKRTVASQMENALIDQVSIDISSHDGQSIFRATGSSVAFDGFLKVYVESVDETETDGSKHKKLPVINEGDQLSTEEITTSQHFTQPPPRFNEASLVKKLEELGIGRPSTYASIINVLQERKYATLQKRTFVPDSIGFLATSFLRNFFKKYVEYGFTAGLEEELDDISNGKLKWRNVLDKFWKEFNENISNANELTRTVVIQSVEDDIKDYVFKDVEENRACPLCGLGKVNLKLGKFGAFLGCSRYPDCKYTKQFGDSGSQRESAQPQDQNLDIKIGEDTGLGGDAVFLKNGPFGYYLEWETTKDATGKKPKRVSVPKFVGDPAKLTIDDAMTLGQLPKALGKRPETGDNIQLALGRFGPYLKVGSKSFRLENDVNVFKITLTEAIGIINDPTRAPKKGNV
jgi:DNA topoisomerase-1